MRTEKNMWQIWKTKSAGLSRWLLPAAGCFLELLFHFWVGGSLSAASLLHFLGFSIAFGGLMNLPAAFLPPKGSKWACALCSFLFAAAVMVELLLEQAYGSFMRPTRIVTGAAGVLTDYTDVVIDMILNNWWRILIALIPMFLVVFSGRPKAEGAKRWVLYSLVCCILGSGLGGQVPGKREGRQLHRRAATESGQGKPDAAVEPNGLVQKKVLVGNIVRGNGQDCQAGFAGQPGVGHGLVNMYRVFGKGDGMMVGVAGRLFSFR